MWTGFFFFEGKIGGRRKFWNSWLIHGRERKIIEFPLLPPFRDEGERNFSSFLSLLIVSRFFSLALIEFRVGAVSHPVSPPFLPLFLLDKGKWEKEQDFLSLHPIT